MNEVHETVSRFCEAWNRHDVDALASMWSEDGELNHPWGFHAVGRAAVRELLAAEHQGAMSASRLRILEVSAQREEPNVLAEIDGILEEVRAPNGRPYDLRHKLSVMFVPAERQWKIRTMAAVANPRA